MLYLICVLHQTTTQGEWHLGYLKLYLICVLHQTTTLRGRTFLRVRLYLICVLHQTTTADLTGRRKAALYLICVLHQTTTHTVCAIIMFCCILFVFYIKPQRAKSPPRGCVVVSYLCSTSNHNDKLAHLRIGKVVSYLCSTSNHNLEARTIGNRAVVSYLCSTSNHNKTSGRRMCRRVVSYLCSTSNHNISLVHFRFSQLYLICVLHQTTTAPPSGSRSACCILFVFYIKPQLSTGEAVGTLSCILFVFYIKPQQKHQRGIPSEVVSYLCSTSNHNHYAGVSCRWMLYLICVLHQTTTATRIH